MGLFPSQLSPVFPISKGRLLSFIRTEARSKVIIPFNGAFCLRHDERGEKEHPSTSVPVSLKGCSLWDNKSYETTQAAENRWFSSCTHHLFRYTQGFESMAWVWDSLQNETKRAPALTKPLGCQNRWLLTQTTNQVLLGELPPSQIKLQPLVFVQTSIHAI